MKINSLALAIFLAFIFFGRNILAQEYILFTENRGQWHENVLYKANLQDCALFLEKNGFTYNLIHPQDIKHSHAHYGEEADHHDFDHQCGKVRAHAFKVHFENAKSNPIIKAYEREEGYLNFFTGTNQNNWAGNINQYKSVVYENIYNNIDLKLQTQNFNLAYDFIVKPYAKVSDIQLVYEGIEAIYLKDKNLIIKTSVNEIIELQPFAYQISKGEKEKIQCTYHLVENKLSFEFPKGYDTSRELIIDPELIFATYSGSTADNWGFTATFDDNGNVYSGGIVADIGYPVSIGAYQTSFGGLWDIGIIKYNSAGTQRLFATYIGGLGVELPHSLIVNKLGELLIYGTTSSPNFPTTNGAYDNTYNGGISMSYDGLMFDEGTDIYIAKLSGNGTQLLASTFVGGSGNDGLNYRDCYLPYNQTGNDTLYYNYGDGARGEIIIDDNDNVYIGSTTFSNDFPVTENAIQTNIAGKQEGVILKLNSNLTDLIWSSYIGGTGDEAVYSVDVDSDYNLFITGGTTSADFPTTTGSYLTQRPGGTADAFVAKIAANGKSILASSYFGSSAYDQSYFVRLDKFDNAYIFGQTKASGTTLVKDVQYYQANSGQFIAKFSNNLNELQWSTVFGTGSGKPNISPTAFAVDICGRIYLAGSGREWPQAVGLHYDPVVGGDNYFDWNAIEGTQGMQITPNAYQTQTDGMDFYVMVIDQDANNLEYATFFGELAQPYPGCLYSGHDHVDGGTSRFDKKGAIYHSVCGSCGGCQSLPVYPNPGVWSPSNNSSNCNNAVFKIQLFNDYALADFEVPNIVCAPASVTFNNRSIGQIFEWDFGDGSPLSSDENPTHTYNSSGIFNVRLIVEYPASCNIRDTIYHSVQVMANNVSNLNTVEICVGEIVQIGVDAIADPSITYSWSPTYGLFDPTVANPHAAPEVSTLYRLLIDNGTCTDTFYQQVNVVRPQKFSRKSNIWYFGENAGLDFNTIPVTVLNDGQINTREGCATICNYLGELLFYTDGQTVWDKNHNPMPNGFGLAGDYSSTQSAIILQSTANPKEFYIFTTGPIPNPELRYSVVNMNLNNGLGDIIFDKKNILLLENSTEKLTAIEKQGEIGYWIVAHTHSNNNFYVFPFGNEGIGNPQIYSRGSILTNENWNNVGYMKLSPNGKYLVNCISGFELKAELFNFSNETGEIGELITQIPAQNMMYGAEFSPNDSLLYLSEMHSTSPPFSGLGRISQYKINVENPEEIIASRIILIESNYSYGALQLAPDGKIYVAKENGFDNGVSFLGVINNPNKIGTDCNYIEDGLNLNQSATLIGLPSLPAHYFQQFDFKATNLCTGNLSEFRANIPNEGFSLEWNFNDAGSDNNTATGTIATHTFSSPGEYIVELYVSAICPMDTIRRKVIINPLPLPEIGGDYTLCSGASVILNAGEFPHIQWNNGSTEPTQTVVAAGEYSVTVIDENACINSDTTYVTLLNEENKRAVIWYFGSHVGLDFKQEPPQILLNSQMQSVEGCASICGETGNLLFYTDGVTVWNYTHNIMANGTELFGDQSSTQSAIIVPAPNQNNIYYLFTVDNVGGENGLCYSIIDMNMNFGQGEVVSKNNNLLALACEKLTAVKNPAGNGIWVIAHEFGSNAFYSWLIEENKLPENPVISMVGSVHNANNEQNAQGTLKVSPDGAKIAVTVVGSNFIEIFNFNSLTGQIYSPTVINSISAPYGLEFSPAGNKLYISSWNDTNIYQFDLKANNIESSKQIIGQMSGIGAGGALQLAPNDKIYVANSSIDNFFLGCIQAPDSDAENCDFNSQAVYFSDNVQYQAYTGLPAFIQSYFNTFQADFSHSNHCENAEVQFSVLNPEEVMTVEWNFGNGNTSNDFNTQFLFESAGVYEVQLAVESVCGHDTVTKSITIHQNPKPTLGDEIIGCYGNNIILDPGNFSSYLWNDNSQEPTLNVSYTGIYTVEVTNEFGCTGNDTVTINLRLNESKRNNIWYFGNNAGIDFNEFPPTVLANGQTNALRGCATMCDAHGNLLFYSNGISVWNKNHEILTSQLAGGNGASQSPLIVPAPNNYNKYYIFTAANVAQSPGVSYSVFDTEYNPLGEIITLNQNLESNMVEKLTAVRHANGVDVWIICHKWASDAFYVYLLDENGISVPNVSYTGTSYSASSLDGSGIMKASPDGTILASALVGSGKVDLLNFNKENGEIEHFMTLTGYSSAYGVEFSPDGTKLYISTRWSGTVLTGKVYQIDLSNNYAMTVIAENPNVQLGQTAMQLAPDGKIYVAFTYTSFLDVIHNPNMPATACMYEHQALNLGSGIVNMGLQNIISDTPPPVDFSFQNICQGAATQFLLSNYGYPRTVNWNFGDGTTTNVQNPEHIFANAGTYFVQLEVVGACENQNVSHQVEVFPAPDFNLGDDMQFCGAFEYIIKPTGDLYNYLWNDNSTADSLHITTAGEYWLQAENSFGCTNFDSINFIQYENPILNLGNDITLCFGTSTEIDGGENYSTYLWNNAYNQQVIEISEAGEYILLVSNEYNCFASDTIEVFVLPQIEIEDIIVSNITCYDMNNGEMGIIPFEDSPNFLYSLNNNPPSTETHFADLSEGFYNITVYDENNCSRIYENIEITEPQAITATINIIPVNCYNETNGEIEIIASGGTGNLQYSLNNGTFQNENAFENLYAGIYSAQIQDENFCSLNIENIELLNPVELSLSLQKTDITCFDLNNGTITANGTGGTGILLYSINNSNFSAQNIFNDLSEGFFTIVVKDENNCTASQTIEIIRPTEITANLIVTPITCYNANDGILEIQNATGGIGGLQFVLDNGTPVTNPVFENLGSGLHNVQIFDENNCQKTYNFNLENPAEISIEITGNLELCNSESTTLEATGADSYIWQTTPPQSGSQITVNPQVTTTYTVTGTIGQCSASESVEVIVYELPETSLPNAVYMCENQSITLNAGEGYLTYIWSTGETGVSSIMVSDEGIYWVEVTNENCTTRDTCEVIFVYDFEEPFDDRLWYFGNLAGIDFTDETPVVLTNNYMIAGEGTSTVADESGNLLFYTNGIEVRNRTHQIMANGTDLMSHSSASQAVVSVKNPANSLQYFIFTVDDCEHSLENGLRYSILDLSLNGGLGDITETKNVLLYSLVTEKLAATPHANDIDMWVLAHEYGTNTFLAFLISETGISEPVTSSCGTIHQFSLDDNCGEYAGARGLMKISQQGNKIALGIQHAGIFELFDFDNNTGQVSNPITLEFEPDFSAFPVEFSPAGNRLYVGSPAQKQVFQFTISSNNPQTIINSKQLVHQQENEGVTDFRAAPDGRLYLSLLGHDFLDVIHQPDANAELCQYEENYVDLQGRHSFWGLGNHVSARDLQPGFLYSNVCLGAVTNFFAVNTEFADSVRWNFGDPASDNNTSTEISPAHTYLSVGTYTVSLNIYGFCNTYNVMHQVVIYPNPTVELGDNITECNNQEVIIDAGEGYFSYIWSTGEETQSIAVLQDGTYSLTVTNSYGCAANDAVNINFVESPVIQSFSATPIHCFGDSNGTITIVASGGTGIYLYSLNNSPLQNSPIFENLPMGSYEIVVTDNIGCTSAPEIVTITAPDELIINYIATQPACPDDSYGNIQLSTTGGNGPYYYSLDGSTFGYLNHFENITLGNHSATVRDASGCTDVIDFQIIAPDDFSVAAQIVHESCTGYCDGNISISVSGGTSPYIANWNNSSSGFEISNLCPQEYELQIMDNNNCLFNTSYSISSLYQLPLVSISASNTELAIGESTQLTTDYFPNFEYLWQPESFLDNANIYNPVATPVYNISYTLTVTDEHGCKGQNSIDLHIVSEICKEPYIFVPNAFTPNDASHGNETLKVHSQVVTEIQFSIFNRWGNKVFETTNINEGWDGTYNGEPQIPGVYVYYLKAGCYDDSTFEKKGNITLIR